MDVEAPVVIIGGGVVGLSASLLLAAQGIRCALIERHAGTNPHPRARGLHGRTMEVMRELGLERAIRDAGAALSPAVGVLRGSDLRSVLDARGDGGWLTRWLRGRFVRGEGSRHSPSAAARCTQDVLEPLLAAAGRERGVEQHWGARFSDLAITQDGVVGRLDDGRRVRAQYLIAADGARSPIREALGIARSGSPTFGHQLNVLFRADLRAFVQGREFSMCLVENERVRGLIASIDNADRWVVHISYDPERESMEDFTPDRLVGLVQAALGMPDLPVRIEGVSPWQSAARVAERFREGPVFLAGDAAHSMPPWGGFGANTGVQDVHNLAWKLAAVLQGRADPRLLDSYEAERRPLALTVTSIAASMNDERGLMRMPKGLGLLGVLWATRKVLPYNLVGYGYGSSIVSLERGTPPGPGSTDVSGRPGTRLPHRWLSDGVSTLDRLAGRFRLFSSNAAWLDAAHSVPVDAETVEPAFARAIGAGVGAILARPDGFVAWRSRSSRASTAELSAALRRSLGFAA